MDIDMVLEIYYHANNLITNIINLSEEIFFLEYPIYIDLANIYLKIKQYNILSVGKMIL